MSATFTAEEILSATGGRLVCGVMSEQGRGRIVWDLDEVTAGDWFIAIPSEFQDPHDHLAQAFAKGARGCIVNRRQRYASATERCTLISVPDTRLGLLDLVRYWRHAVGASVVGVSGSMGRRATMILINQLLQDKLNIHLAFMGNLGWFGCIRGILAMPKGTEVLVFEAGAVECGDITRIGGALDPDLAVITGVNHVLPSPERDSRLASLYCELLETLKEFPEERISAVIFDQNCAVRERSKQLLGNLTAVQHSLSGNSLAQRVSQQSLEQLSVAMQQAIGQAVSEAELWCATEAAKVLGLSKHELEKILGLTSDAQTDAGSFAA